MNARITDPIRSLISQLEEMLEGLTEEEYKGKIGLLSNASIGQHTRHIIEFFFKLLRGYEKGTVNYNQRKRDAGIKTNRIYPRNVQQVISISRYYEAKPLTLVV